jgi:hypothetical protein
MADVVIFEKMMADAMVGRTMLPKARYNLPATAAKNRGPRKSHGLRSMQKYWFLLFALIPGLCLAANGAPPPVQSYDVYKSWLVACDNTLSCEAKGFNQSGDRAEFVIKREAGPTGALNAWIASEAHFGLDQVKMDGAPVPLGPGWHRKDDDDSTTVSTSGLAAAQDLVKRLRNAKTLDLPEGKSVPLDGFAAALLRMDARQGRAGGETALLARGNRPASVVPPAPRLPRVPAREITATLAKGEAQKLIDSARGAGAKTFSSEGCDGKVEGMDPAAYALDETRALVLIPCIMGAYQGSYLGFLVQRRDGAAALLDLPASYQGNDSSQATLTDLTEAAFAPQTGTLAMSAKGRGLADCGFAASWIWSGNGFVLSALSTQDACGGLQPGDWPTVFRSVQ